MKKTGVMFKNLAVLKIKRFKMDASQLENILSQHALQPCSGDQMESVGWLPPKHGDTRFVHCAGEQMLISMGVEKRLLPASVIAHFLEERVESIEEQQGHKVGRREMKEIKEAVTLELIPKAFVTRKETMVWIDPVGGWFVVNASSAEKAAEVLGTLRKCIDAEDMALELVETKESPVAAMTGWLASSTETDGAAFLPEKFTIDRDCELRGEGEERPLVRYAHHALDSDEVVSHVESGKRAVKLALTWGDRISFVLTENALLLKKIDFLDVVMADSHQAAEANNADELFDADFTLMTGELRGLLGDLVLALGGLVEKEV